MDVALILNYLLPFSSLPIFIVVGTQLLTFSSLPIFIVVGTYLLPFSSLPIFFIVCRYLLPFSSLLIFIVVGWYRCVIRVCFLLPFTSMLLCPLFSVCLSLSLTSHHSSYDIFSQLVSQLKNANASFSSNSAKDPSFGGSSLVLPKKNCCHI